MKQMEHTAEERADAAERVALLAEKIMGRAQVQGWRGKKADDNAVEAVCGALAACIAMHGEEDARTRAVSMFAAFVGIRGIAYVAERAKAAPKLPKAPPAPDSVI